jgi:hypothetical protein
MMLAGALTMPGTAFGDEPECPEIKYRLIDLHMLPVHSYALGISNPSSPGSSFVVHVVGELRSTPHPANNTGAFHWAFQALPSGGHGIWWMRILNVGGDCPSDQAVARDVNIYGRIIGNTGDSLAVGDIILWDVGSGPETCENLSDEEHIGSAGRGNALNDNDPPAIVGMSSDESVGFHYVLDGPLTTLLPQENFFSSEAFGVSDFGPGFAPRPVGAYFESFNPTPGTCVQNLDPRSTWWLGSEPQLLLGIPPVGRGFVALDINNNLEVVGRSYWVDPEETCRLVAMYWKEDPFHPDDVYLRGEVLPFIGQDPEDTIAHAISNPIMRDEEEELHMVGRSVTSNVATLWRGPAGPLDLPGEWTAFDLDEISCNDLLPPYQLREATDVNDLGWIVGWMTINPGTPEAKDHAVLLIPFDEYPGDPADLNHDGAVDGADMLLMFSHWGDCPDPCCCLADLNGDGVVDGADSLILMASWGCPLCESNEQPASLAELINSAGITSRQWQESIDVMSSGTEAEKANYLCWLEYHFELCDSCPTCPDSDPFAE